MEFGLRRFLLPLLLLLASVRTDAVCLNPDYSLKAEYGRADQVVAVRVVNARLVKDPEDPEGFAGITYTVEVFRRWRGPATSKLEVYSENSSGRFEMEVGRGYLLFLTKYRGNSFTANNCGNSGPFEAREREMTMLDALRLPRR
jgi:hypothetical protein